MSRFRTAFAALLGAGVLLTGIGSAHAQANCKWYGTTALRQQKLNEQMRCGFSGPQWHSKLGAHISWCSRQPPEAWKASARNRDKMLEDCKRR